MSGSTEQGAERAGPGVLCLNCGARALGSFCASCGQRTDTGRLGIGTWVSAVGDAFSFAEGRFLRTAIGMTRRPGAVPREFAAGRRVRWVGPFRYAVTTSALWLIAFTLMPREVTEQEQQVVEGFTAWGQALNLGLLPLLALAIHFAFLGTRTRYAEHLCMTLFVFGHVFLFRALLLTTAAVAGLGQSFVMGADQVAVLVCLVSGMWGFHRSTTRVWARPLRIVAALVLISLASMAATQAMSRAFGGETGGSAAPLDGAAR